MTKPVDPKYWNCHNPTNAPVPRPAVSKSSCSETTFITELDCLVFKEQNALRTEPEAWLDRLVAFKMALPYNLRYTADRNLDQAIWRIEDFIN